MSKFPDIRSCFHELRLEVAARRFLDAHLDEMPTSYAGLFRGIYKSEEDFRDEMNTLFPQVDNMSGYLFLTPNYNGSVWSRMWERLCLRYKKRHLGILDRQRAEMLSTFARIGRSWGWRW